MADKLAVAARREPELGRRGLAITGLGTFTGARLAERLLEGDAPPRIVALDLRLPRRLEGRGRFPQVDLTGPPADNLVAGVLPKGEGRAGVHPPVFTDPTPATGLC